MYRTRGRSVMDDVSLDEEGWRCWKFKILNTFVRTVKYIGLIYIEIYIIINKLTNLIAN